MPKNIIFCFDGTKNEPGNAVQKTNPFKRDQKKDSSISNVLKLHLMFGGNLDNSLKTTDQHSLYYPGVGTYGGKLKQLLNAALALPNGDIRTIIGAARADLKRLYKDGDQIYIFGFSRGAAIARRFASLLHKEPAEYFSVAPAPKNPVRFLGVFDTVASIGSPDLKDEDLPKYDVMFQGGFTVSPAVQEALHVVSIDENRKAFKPTLMNAEDRITEIWFPGVHSDIGGGYWKDALSDAALDFMLRHMKRREFPVRIYSLDEINFTALAPAEENFTIERDDLELAPSALGTLHTHNRGSVSGKVTLQTRIIQVLKKDKPAPGITPLAFAGVAQRVREDGAYNPKALRDIAHRLIDRYGVIHTDAAGKERLFTGTRNYFS